jgi:hypothetical protein
LELENKIVKKNILDKFDIEEIRIIDVSNRVFDNKRGI